MALTFERALPLLTTPHDWHDMESTWASMQIWISRLNQTVTNIVDEVNTLGGRTVRSYGTASHVPASFGAADEGIIIFLNDVKHFLRWTGAVWEFMDGGNKFFADHAVAPGAGWALCDGSTVTYLVDGGASLTGASIVLPNLTGTAAYKKTAGAYVGTIAAASGASASGGDHDHGAATGNASPGTDSQGAHTHADGTGGVGITVGVGGSAWWSSGNSTSNGAHTHTVNSHGHSISSSGSHTHGAGSLDPAHLNVLPYFRL